MKIALFGQGKMGQLIAQLACSQGHTVVARFSKKHATFEELKQADLALDFSHPTAVLTHVQACLAYQKPLIIGTTGWDTQVSDVRHLVEQGQIGCLAAANFSLGIHLFKSLVKQAATLFNPHPQYDVAAVEYHHRQKVDHPSGTALTLAEEIKRQMPRLQSLDFTSVRCGAIPGTHEILFDSFSDTITLTHQARNREGFAQGALLAAEWLLPRQGYFTLDDFLQDILP